MTIFYKDSPIQIEEILGIDDRKMPVSYTISQCSYYDITVDPKRLPLETLKKYMKEEGSKDFQKS